MDTILGRHDFFDRSPVKAASLYRRAALRLLGRRVGNYVYFATNRCIPGVARVTVDPVDGMFVYRTPTESFYFPEDIPVKRFMMAMGYQRWLREKYRCAGFVEVEPGDVVVDCGAFVGGFSSAVAPLAGAVHAVEPSPRPFAALTRNIGVLPNVVAHNIGLFDFEAVLNLNLSSTCVDDSLLHPDTGATGHAVPIRVRRIDEWAAEIGLDRIDFLKVEAEGVETEIVKSIGILPVGKIAVDCSPERDGMSNLKQIAAHLEGEGFAVRSRGWMLFARANEPV
jgi:FkbM family methyltransferase